MTLFAGIYSRDERHALPESACDALRARSRAIPQTLPKFSATRVVSSSR